MAFRDTFLNMLGVETQEVQKTDNSVFKSARDFLRNGSRERLYPTWSDIKMSDSDMYRGYSYAVIQKRGNKVASLAKNNLKTWAKPEVVDEFQKKGETPFHPYLKLIEDSTKFTEKQFWKNISIYLDLAGRYYLGVIRNEVRPLNPKLPTITTDPTEFIMLNPYEIRRVVDKNGQVAGYIERKSDGRYREWPLHQIIEIRELNPFDPDNSQWAMTDAAKNAVYTINQSGDYTRQSLNGNIDAPGIITTDVLLTDEDFANFKARITQHTKGEPLFGNGTGAINWDSMQIDLDKAALLDINEINRTELFAVSGTSKTSLGIEQSGTTRETARVQSEQFVSDTAQPRLEDIVDFLNLDYKKHYKREYDKTGYKIEVESAVGKDYDTEQKATALKQSQFQLAMQLVQAGYTTETAYQFAEGEIDFADLELEKGLDKPKNPEQPEDPDENASNPQNTPPRNDSGGGQDKSSVDENKGTENANNGLDLGLEPHSDLVANGGKGSGNFGHAGRPGEVGGSGKGGVSKGVEEYLRSTYFSRGQLPESHDEIIGSILERLDKRDIESWATAGDYDAAKALGWESEKSELDAPITQKELWKDVKKQREFQGGGKVTHQTYTLDGKTNHPVLKAMSSKGVGSSLPRTEVEELARSYLEKAGIDLSEDSLVSLSDKGKTKEVLSAIEYGRLGSAKHIIGDVLQDKEGWHNPRTFGEDVQLDTHGMKEGDEFTQSKKDYWALWKDYDVQVDKKIKKKNSVEGEERLPLTRNGGVGSGNFGHKGRPGLIGGSGKDGFTGISFSEGAKNYFEKYPERKKEFDDVIKEYKKIGLKRGFHFTTNAYDVAAEGEGFFDVGKYSGRTITDTAEGGSTVYVSPVLFEKGVGEKFSFEKNGRVAEVDTTFVGVLRHELGHLYMTQLFLEEAKPKGDLNQSVFERYNREFLMDSKCKRPFLGGKWSMYADINSGEAIAEAFSNPDYSEDTRKTYDYVRKYKIPEHSRWTYRDNSTQKNMIVACVGYPINDEVLKEYLEERKENNHCTCEHDHKVETFINEVNQDDGKVVEKAYKEFLQEVRDIEKETIDASVKKVEVNAFEISDIIGPRKRKALTEKLKNALHKYWWLIFPLFANNSMSKRNTEFGKDIGFVFNNELQAGVDDNALRVAEGHMETILNDILGASNRAYTNVLEEAAAEIIIKIYDDSPTKWEKYFEHKPTMAEALSSIRRTDILEENRKIYEKANKMAFEGYNRRDIIKAIRNEYSHISEQRATLIARNETSRAFTRSQFEVDKQFLNGVGKLGQAYKVWYSRRPANEQDKICDFCNEMIRTSEENPIPFEEPFIKYGDSMEVMGDDGKLRIFTANYEDIEGGCLHPNCMCGYHLVFKNDAGEFIKTLNGGAGSGNFGHAGRPGEVGGSSDGKSSLDSWKERVKKIDNAEELLDLQESIVDENVTNYLKKISEDMTDEEKNAIKDFYDKTSAIRERLFELEDADLKHADYLISEWVSGTLDWENRKIDFDPIDIELSKSTARGLLENDKNLTAYRVQATDEMLPSKGASYSLSKDFSDPSVPYKFAQKVTEENVILTPNIVEAGYGYGGNPNWQHEIILKNDERLKATNNSVVLNGGKGSGNFGHSGRPGEVGGSGDGKLSFAKLRKLTNWTDNEWAYASGYFASFDRTTAVNNYLKTGEDKLIEGSDGEIMASDCARELQKKIENTEFPEDGVLYRGIAVKKDKFFELVENGFQVTGFQSTSVDRKKAEDILNLYQDRWIKRRGIGEDAYLHLVLKINVKKGQKFAASLHDSEKEVVLPDKTKFKVADTEKNKSLINFMKEASRAAGYDIEELEVDYE